MADWFSWERPPR